MDPSTPPPGGLSRFIINEIKDHAIFLIDPQGTILSWNTGARLLLGYTADEIVGRPVDTLYTPEDLARDLPRSEMATALRTGRSEHLGHLLRKDRSRFWADETMTPLHDESGTHIGFLKITRDLSDRKSADDAARHAEARYRTVVEGVTDYAILLLDPDNRITGWNPGATLIIGYTEGEVRGKPGSIIFVPEDRARGAVEHELTTALRDGRAEDERWHLRKDGSRFYASGVLTALRDDAGELIGFTKILRDQTRRKIAEEALKAANQTLEQHVADRTAALVAYQTQLRSLVREHALTEHRQRRQLATELHDHLVQTLALCRIKAAVVEQPSLAPHRVAEEARLIKTYLEQAIAYTRTLMADLSPTTLNKDDLYATIEWVATRMKDHGLTVTVHDDGRDKPVAEEWLTLLFQGTRELLFNVLKHARTKQATVTLARHADEIHVTVTDAGPGFTLDWKSLTPSPQGHYGLFSLRERVDLLGGRLDISPSPTGTRATLIAPASQP